MFLKLNLYQSQKMDKTNMPTNEDQRNLHAMFF